MMARLATRVAVTTEDSLPYLPKGKTVVSGYPVRTGLPGGGRRRGTPPAWTRPELKTLLVSGGSQGAHSLNQIVADNLPALLDVMSNQSTIRRNRHRRPDARQRRPAGAGRRSVTISHAYLPRDAVGDGRRRPRPHARRRFSTLGELPLLAFRPYWYPAPSPIRRRTPATSPTTARR